LWNHFIVGHGNAANRRKRSEVMLFMNSVDWNPIQSDVTIGVRCHRIPAKSVITLDLKGVREFGIEKRDQFHPFYF
jgi:hypothetical protein